MTVPELSAIEKLVVVLVAGGSSTSRIADDLGVSPRTVEWHLARARHKLERTAELADTVRAPGGRRHDARTEGGT